MLTTEVNPQERTIQDAMSEALLAMGMDAMSRDVKTETDVPTLRRYARVIVKHAQVERRGIIANAFRLHRPRLY